MTLPIVLHPDPRLRAQCAAVTTFDDDLRRLAADMIETMYAARGLGLAAPQVGRSLRLFVFDPWCLDEVGGDAPMVVCNPLILLREGTQRQDEGCLSFPGLFEVTERARKVTVRAQDERGQVFEKTLENLPAFALQHEIDHLEGILLIDRVIAKRRGSGR